MIKDIHPLVPLSMGVLLLGGAISHFNPDTRTLMAQRQQSQQLQRAVLIEKQNSEVMQAITQIRANCVRVAQVNPTAVYQLPPGTVICDGRTTATIGSNGVPTLLALTGGEE